MSLYLFSNIIGTYIFNEKIKLIDSIEFKSDYIELYRKIQVGEFINEERKLIEKQSQKGIVVLNDKNELFYDTNLYDFNTIDREVFEDILEYFSKKQFRELFAKRNSELTKDDMKNSSVNDVLIIQAINNIDELEISINTMSKRLREWYELYFPEISRKLTDHENFVEAIHGKTKSEIMNEFKIKDSFGTELAPRDLGPMNNLAKTILNMIKLKESHVEYLEEILGEFCPNIKELCGAMVASRLISLAGSLRKLSLYPSSTVQTLGAEKAMFRHLKTGNLPPKYGVIIMHPFVSSAQKNNRGKAARMFANKISIAAKVDFFGGNNYEAYEIKSSLEKDLKNMTPRTIRPKAKINTAKKSFDSKPKGNFHSDSKSRNNSKLRSSESHSKPSHKAKPFAHKSESKSHGKSRFSKPKSTNHTKSKNKPAKKFKMPDRR